jgi:hypothetical protein
VRLTKKAQDAIAEQSPAIKNELALELDCSENSINRYLRENEDNNDLTKEAALVIIRKRTGLKNSQILEKAVERV